MDDFIIETRTVDNVLVVSIRGDLDAFTVQQVRKSLDGLIAAGNHHIVIDCANVRYVNSTAIGVLVGRRHHLHRLQGDLALAALNARVTRIIELIGGQRLFSIYETEHEAIASLRNKASADDAAEDIPDPGLLALNSR